MVSLSGRDILGIIAAIVVIVFGLYRLALAYDMVPKNFKPAEIAQLEYKEFKIFLLNSSAEPGIMGNAAKITLNFLMSFERDVDKQEASDTQLDEMSAKCTENSVFRFFMYLGASEEEKKKCTEVDMKLKRAIEESTGIKETPRATGDDNKTNTTAPPATAPQSP